MVKQNDQFNGGDIVFAPSNLDAIEQNLCAAVFAQNPWLASLSPGGGTVAFSPCMEKVVCIISN
jgi:hypothetical protein